MFQVRHSNVASERLPARLHRQRLLSSRIQVLAFRYKPEAYSWVHVGAGIIIVGFNAMLDGCGYPC